MNLTLMIKLEPSAGQKAGLLKTMERINEACNDIAGVAFESGVANRHRLQELVYYDTRERFELSAQMTVRAIAKVCDAYKRDKRIKPTFRPRGAVAYDQRILSFSKDFERVSILTLEGREVIPLSMGEYQRTRLRRLRGQCELIYRGGEFYLAVVVDVSEPEEADADEWLGVDLGIRNIAVDSTGEEFSGSHLNSLRNRNFRLRQRLQSKGTRSAKRLLRKRRRKETNFARNTNHIISKRLVAKAKGTGRGIALEDLKGIRDRITVRKAQRRNQHSWGFHQLRSFIEYKAKLAGVPVRLVDPRNTSRTCTSCGHVSKKNRRSRDSFCCVSCGFAGPADTVAAINIGRRAAVNQPYATAV